MAGPRIIEISRGKKKDERGWVLFPLQNAPPELTPDVIDWDSMHLVVSRPGAVRGNHYHPDQAEWLFLCAGASIFSWEEDGAGRRVELTDGAYLIRIPPGLPHAVVNQGDEDSLLLAFREKGGSGETLGAKIFPDQRP
ncbi:MAG: cupin domain-containing protein [Pseudomonadota bacterium]